MVINDIIIVSSLLFFYQIAICSICLYFFIISKPTAGTINFNQWPYYYSPLVGPTLLLTNIDLCFQPWLKTTVSASCLPTIPQ